MLAIRSNSTGKMLLRSRPAASLNFNANANIQHDIIGVAFVDDILFGFVQAREGVSVFAL